MFLQRRGIPYQTRRYHSTNIAPCFTHDHTHHCYKQLICIVSLFSTSFRCSCCHRSRCAPVSNQPCAPFPTHYSQDLHNYCCMSKWPTAGGYSGRRAERHVPSGLAAAGRDSATATARARAVRYTWSCTWPSFGFCITLRFRKNVLPSRSGWLK